MSDMDLVRKLLAQNIYGIERIKDSFSTIETHEDFLASNDGMRRYDSIIVNLLAMGENLKRIDRMTDGQLLALYHEVPWVEIIKLRDVISHHYFDLDAPIIFEICRDYLAQLESVLRQIIADLAP